jgi:hypothetical protein
LNKLFLSAIFIFLLFGHEFALKPQLDVPDFSCCPKIRVVNHSEYTLEYVSLFSMKFDDMKPRDTSKYKSLKFDPLKDDPLMYCVVGGQNFGRYLKMPDEQQSKVTYVVDSIKKGILHVRLTNRP